MPRIITINSQKGGTSKTTLSLNLYHYFTDGGLTCALVDADEQGSLTQLFEDNEDMNLIPRANIDSWQDVVGIEDADVIIIDTPPYLASDLPAIFAVSDIVVIPFRAAAFDILALNATVGLVESAKKENGALRACIVLTQGIHSTGFNKDARLAVKEYGLPVLSSVMKMRVDYARSLDTDKAIYSTENPKAISEIEAIGNEIINLVDVG